MKAWNEDHPWIVYEPRCRLMCFRCGKSTAYSVRNLKEAINHPFIARHLPCDRAEESDEPRP